MPMRFQSTGRALAPAFATLILALASMGLLGACGSGQKASADSNANSEAPSNVRVLTLVESNLREYLTLSGPAHPLHGTRLSAEEGGRVERIVLDKGATVKKGAVLVLQDRALLKADMNAQAATRDLSKFNSDRMKELFEANAVSEIEFLRAKTEYMRNEAMAEAARIRYDRAAIKAPFDGVVTDRYVEPGELIAPGTAVARVVNPYVLKLESAVTEREITWVKAGQEAEIIFDGVEELGRGYVHWVSFEADPMTGKFPLEIRIDNKNLRFNPGIIARARVIKVLHENVIAVPRDAVVQKGEGPIAFVVEGDRARRRSLELGSDQGLMVIVEEGLDAGEKLVVRGQREIHEGSLVAVREESQAADGSSPDDPALVSQEGAEGEQWRAGASEGDGR